jgi:hypothetical protein
MFIGFFSSILHSSFIMSYQYLIICSDHRGRDRTIYNYLCNQYLSPLTLWIRFPLTMWYKLSVTCDRSVVFYGYSGFFHKQNWLPRYNWNIGESGVKLHNPNPNPLCFQKELYWSAHILRWIKNNRRQASVKIFIHSRCLWSV